MRTSHLGGCPDMGWSLNSLKGGYIGDGSLGFRLQGLNSVKGLNTGVLWGLLRRILGV